MEKIFFPSKSSFAVFVWLAIALEVFLHFSTLDTFATEAFKTSSQQILRLFKTDFPALRDAVDIFVTPAQASTKVVAIPTDDLQCMAENIYYEAANESYAGKIAVGQVVLNRVKAPGFPRTVCAVIWEGSQSIHTGTCQFSWTCAPRNKVNTASAGWAQSLRAAKELLSKKDTVIDITEGALNYHANYVSPLWSKQLRLVAQIDKHLFYRNPSSELNRHLQ